MKRSVLWFLFGTISVILLAGCGSNTQTTNASINTTTPDPEPTATQNPTPNLKVREYEIVTLFPKDVIQAIDDPKYLTSAEADQQYEPEELVIGVAFDGEARAYSIPLLSRHEIVNTKVGNQSIAVTW